MNLTSKYLSLAFLISLYLFSCTPTDERHESTGEQMELGEQNVLAFKDTTFTSTWNSYQTVREGLINSNTVKASSGARDLAKATESQNPQITKLASSLANTEDLEEQRKIFSDISEKLQPMLSEQLADGNIFKQYCPMAFNNKGAYWMSNESRIRNPYFGDKMMTCGTTEDIIEGKK